SALIVLAALPRRSELRKEHGFPRQPAAARFGNQVPGPEPPAIPSSSERCETRRRDLLASCGPASIATSRRSTVRVSHAVRVWNEPFPENRATCEPPRSRGRYEGSLPTGESP